MKITSTSGFQSKAINRVSFFFPKRYPNIAPINNSKNAIKYPKEKKNKQTNKKGAKKNWRTLRPQHFLKLNFFVS